jgi:hypothetical protein
MNKNLNKQLICIIFVIISFILFFIFNGVNLHSSGTDGKYFYSVHIAPWSLIPFILIVFTVIMGFFSNVPNESQNRIPAGIFVRAVALMIDFYISIVLTLIPLGFLLVFLEFRSTGLLKWQFERSVKMPHDFVMPLGIITSLLFIITFLSLPLSLKKQTTGQFISGIEIRCKKSMSFPESLLRTLLGYIGLCCFFLGCLPALKDKKKRMWHDKVFGTTPLRVD